jgi:hypothetical protein
MLLPLRELGVTPPWQPPPGGAVQRCHTRRIRSGPGADRGGRGSTIESAGFRPVCGARKARAASGIPPVATEPGAMPGGAANRLGARRRSAPGRLPLPDATPLATRLRRRLYARRLGLWVAPRIGTASHRDMVQQISTAAPDHPRERLPVPVERPDAIRGAGVRALALHLLYPRAEEILGATGERRCFAPDEVAEHRAEPHGVGRSAGTTGSGSAAATRVRSSSGAV